MIPLKVKGQPYHITETLVGRIIRNVSNIDEYSILILEEESFHYDRFPKILALLSTHNGVTFPPNNIPRINYVPDLTHLIEGDIVSIDVQGRIHSLYRINSSHNLILVTEKCNNKCLMCSQPPKLKDDIEYLFNIHRKLIPLIPKDCQDLCITGGEPTLLEDRFYELFTLLIEELPVTKFHVLTNGRKFSNWNFVQKLSNYSNSQFSFGIPLYADYFALHDYIVQAESAFNQTMIGLYNLARINKRVEIRIVLQKLTIKRLEKLARYIYKNLPFVEHVAFMGLENTGYTPHNINLLWIDPHDYMNELTEAVLYLDSFGIPVSIYNLQLCILPNLLWKFSKRSISDWKNVYISECSWCGMKDICGGFFESCKVLHSNYIKPINLKN